jgi:hypothetical protein
MRGPWVRAQVELGVRSGWSTRVFSAAAKLVGAKMIGIDLTESCKDVYAREVGEEGGFAVAGDRCVMLSGDLLGNRRCLQLQE